MAAVALLGHHHREATVAYRGGEPVSVARFLGDVAQTATRLPPGAHVFNLCSDRYRFAVALAAAVCHDRVTLLPPSTAPELLRRIAQQYAGARALIDPGAHIPGLAPGIPVEANGSPHNGAMPAVEAGQLAIVAFTGGSTGQPMPHPRTWRSLTRAAAAAATGLGLEHGGQVTLLGTVPPQSMYGLEAAVMLALCAGFAIHAGQPLYPGDVTAALAQVPGDRVLITTVLHLRALLAADIDLPALRSIVCAAAALPATLAAQAEARYRAPLRELYGCAEAGMLATRRTAQGPHWQTLADVRVHCVGEEARFSGGHVEREVAVSDALELIDAQTFVLGAASADHVNVAGKRCSLACLNHELAGVDGVEDGVFFMPDAAGESLTRPSAFVVAPRLSRETLLARLRTRLDPLFLPRPLHFVQALPRDAAGKLPREALVALAARCAAWPPAAGAVRLLSPNHPVAQGHFPGNPIVPGAVILDCVARVAELRLRLPARAWSVSTAKFLDPVRPGEDLRIAFSPGRGPEVRFECFVDVRAVARGTLCPLYEDERKPVH